MGIVRQQAIGKGARALDIAVCERRRKCALDQIRVSRVEPENFEVICLGRPGVAVCARDQPGEIISGLARPDTQRRRVVWNGSGHRRRQGEPQTATAASAQRTKVRRQDFCVTTDASLALTSPIPRNNDLSRASDSISIPAPVAWKRGESWSDVGPKPEWPGDLRPDPRVHATSLRPWPMTNASLA